MIRTSPAPLPLRVSGAVRDALGASDRSGGPDAPDSRRPVVALESTVVTHGLPRPRNLELARELEAVVRDAGAVPATIGVIGGEIVVGLSDGELARLAGAGGGTGNGARPAPARAPAKASAWNLAALLARGSDAGTTVATTLAVAARVGIRVFATGGIGGVHPAAFDESADLPALARSSAIVVCAGPKSVLDVPATLERLETLGVPVVGWRSERLAGFHVPETDLPVPVRLDEAADVARAFRLHRALGGAGVLISNPVSEGLDPSELRAWTRRAQEDADAAGARGREATPFLLARIAELSGGRTVEANGRLLRENAALAARLAAAVLEDERRHGPLPEPSPTPSVPGPGAAHA